MELSDKQLFEQLKTGIKDRVKKKVQCIWHKVVQYMNILFFTLFIILLVGFMMVRSGVKIVVPDESDSKTYISKKSLVSKTKDNLTVLTLIKKGCLILKCRKGRKYKLVMSTTPLGIDEGGKFVIGQKHYKCYLVINTGF